MLFNWSKTTGLLSLLILSTIVICSPVAVQAADGPRPGEVNFCSKNAGKTEKTPAQSAQKLQVKEFTGKVIAAKTPHEVVSTAASKPSSLNPDVIFQLINDHRKEMGLPEYQKDERLCTLARERGPELAKEVASGNFHEGLYARNLPYWVTENMKYGADEKGAVSWWLTSYIHKKAIEGNFTYSCGECYGDACIQLFTSYIPK